MTIIFVVVSATIAFVAVATLIEQKDRRRTDESEASRMARRYDH